MGQIPFHSRELSWLDFNLRVLQEARRAEYPVLERLKYLSITASNLDEFTMVRVAYLHDKAKGKQKKKDDAGLSAKNQLRQVLASVREFERQQALCLEKLKEDMARDGVELLRLHQLDDKQLAAMEQLYFDTILPVLTPLAVDPARPFPFLANRGLYLGVRLKDERGENRFGLVQIPAILPRFLPLPKEAGCAYLPLEELVIHHLPALFGLHKLKAWGLFRLTRSADFDADEDTDDLLEEMRRTIKKRKRGKPIRLELCTAPFAGEREGAFDKALRDYLVQMLRIRKRYMVKVPGLLDLAALGKLADTQQAFSLGLRLAPVEPVEAADFSGSEDIFSAIRERDRMIHLPYESFDPVLELIRSAGEDPEVLAVKQTLYRVSGNSKVVAALERAAELGKQVTVLVELRARFDEEHNIQWAEKLERSGCHVVYGLTGLKTHCKATLVVRREGEGIRRYVHLSTGNYNDSTARHYTDIGLFTCRPAIGADVSDLFNHLTGYAKEPQYRKLVAAPRVMLPFLLERIDREMENAQCGKPCGIYLKANSLLDVRVVRKLYDASRAGVPVRLVIRGICSLVPGVAGWSENIRVRSVVGRLLEHSRVYRFENGGEPLVYLSSADLMPRNLERRVELLFPVEEPVLRKRLMETMEIIWRDNSDAREKNANGEYLPVVRRGRRHSSQEELARLAALGWKRRGGKKSDMPRQNKHTNQKGEQRNDENCHVDERRGLPGPECQPKGRGQGVIPLRQED